MNFIHCHKQSTAFPVPVCMTLNRWTAAKCADCISSLTDRQKFSSVSKRDVHCAELYRNRSPPNFCGVAPVQNIIQIWRKIYKMRQNLIYGRRWSADSQNSNSWTVPKRSNSFRTVSESRVSLYRCSRKSRLLDKRSLVTHFMRIQRQV